MHFGTHPVVGWAGHPHHPFLLRKAEVIGSGFSALGLEGHNMVSGWWTHSCSQSSLLHLHFSPPPLLPKEPSYCKQKI